LTVPLYVSFIFQKVASFFFQICLQNPIRSLEYSQ
jgi:hypothetical protein